MDIRLVVGLIAFSGVMLSAIIQFWLGKHSEKTKKALEIRAQAYVNLVNAISDIASTSKIQNGSIDVDQLKNLIQAKTQVVLIGSEDVVKELHQFFIKHGSLKTNESFDDFSKLVSVMRVDLSGRHDIKLNVLSETLFGIKPPLI